MFSQLAVVVAGGLLGPLLAAGSRPIVPVLVGELLAGLILGRSGFAILDPSAQPFPAFSALGFAMLMLGAGAEVDLRGPGLLGAIGRGLFSAAIVLAVGVPLAVGLASLLGVGNVALIAVLIAGSSAAVALPAIQERRLDATDVAMLVRWLVIADAMTALLMPLTLIGAAQIPAALVGDALIVLATAVAIVLGQRLIGTDLAREAEQESKDRRWGLRLRLLILLLLILAAIADHSGGSTLLAGLGAGIVVGHLGTPKRLREELVGLASGFFVPAFLCFSERRSTSGAFSKIRPRSPSRSASRSRPCAPTWSAR